MAKIEQSTNNESVQQLRARLLQDIADLMVAAEMDAWTLKMGVVRYYYKDDEPVVKVITHSDGNAEILRILKDA